MKRRPQHTPRAKLCQGAARSHGPSALVASHAPDPVSGRGGLLVRAALRLRRTTALYRPACQLADRALGRAAAGGTAGLQGHVAARRPGLGPAGCDRWPGGRFPWQFNDQTIAMYLSDPPPAARCAKDEGPPGGRTTPLFASAAAPLGVRGRAQKAPAWSPAGDAPKNSPRCLLLSCANLSPAPPRTRVGARHSGPRRTGLQAPCRTD